MYLVGDPVQLPATVISSRAVEHGYDKSLFKRLQSSGFPVQASPQGSPIQNQLDESRPAPCNACYSMVSTTIPKLPCKVSSTRFQHSSKNLEETKLMLVLVLGSRVPHCGPRMLLLQWSPSMPLALSLLTL